ncbi:DUF6090 family protein [Maribacter arcticus]|uniref:DUF6090 family protein n=1 Tax=Maribacter arcticus TaxID=561365 RepID=UPI0030DA334B|tara:strand:- start:1507 stop:2250 length:744 start_codon:yes stop_codon:yes gene_type:complete
MIKFFRKIRQNLLSEGKTRKYLKYAIGEIVLVVIGILIALQINNWNEDRKSEAKKQDYYVQLLDDLNSDIISAQNTIEEFSNHQKEYNDYISSYNNESLTPVKAYGDISKLSLISTPPIFNTNTIEALQNSGDIGLIPSSIRNKLMNLGRLQNLTIQRFEVTDTGQRGITQKLSSLLGATTLPKRLENQPEMKEFLNIDENLRELILVYEGIHRWKSVSQLETIDRLEKMQKEIDTIITLIKKELKK